MCNTTARGFRPRFFVRPKLHGNLVKDTGISGIRDDDRDRLSDDFFELYTRFRIVIRSGKLIPFINTVFDDLQHRLVVLYAREIIRVGVPRS